MSLVWVFNSVFKCMWHFHSGMVLALPLGLRCHVLQGVTRVPAEKARSCQLTPELVFRHHSPCWTSSYMWNFPDLSSMNCDNTNDWYQLRSSFFQNESDSISSQSCFYIKTLAESFLPMWFPLCRAQHTIKELPFDAPCGASATVSDSPALIPFVPRRN